MNSEWADTPKEQAGSSLGTPGAQLAAQREAMGWSVEQISEQLKLAPRQVRALEAGDYAALPNMAVVRGFVRAYAKVVKLDPAPLVAMIEVAVPVQQEVPAPRRDVPQASFTGSRFPSMGERSSKPAPWLVGLAAVVVVAAVGGYAYNSGMISASMLNRGDKDAAASAPADGVAAPVETTLVKPDQEAAEPLQSPNVPLVSVPGQGDVAGAQGANAAQGAAAPGAAGAAGTAPAAAAPAPAAAPVVAGAATAPAVTAAPSTAAPAAAIPAAGKASPVAAPVAQAAPTPAAAAPAATPAAKPAAAEGSGHTLVLKVTEDSWVEIRRPGTTSLISRLVKAGSTETFEIKDPALLIVGKPGGVEATLAGAPLALPTIPGGTISRVNIK